MSKISEHCNSCIKMYRWPKMENNMTKKQEIMELLKDFRLKTLMLRTVTELHDLTEATADKILIALYE